MMVTNRIEVDHQAVAHPDLYADTVPPLFTRPERAYMQPRYPELLAVVNAWLADKIMDDAQRTLSARSQPA